MSKVNSSFKDSIWGADMAKMTLDKIYRYLTAIPKNIRNDKSKI